MLSAFAAQSLESRRGRVVGVLGYGSADDVDFRLIPLASVGKELPRDAEHPVAELHYGEIFFKSVDDDSHNTHLSRYSYTNLHYLKIFVNQFILTSMYSALVFYGDLL